MDMEQIIKYYDQEKHIFFNDKKLMFKEIISEALDIESDFFDSENSSDIKQTLGYVFIIISDEYLKERRSNILLTGLLICFVGLMVAVSFAYFFSRKMSKIFVDISQTIEELKKGNFEVKLTEKHSGKTGQLFSDINVLAERLHNHNIEMKNNIANATGELQEALGKMELQNEELGRARKKAELANQSKDQFLAKISHELRTPVNAINGFAKTD